MTVLSPEVLSYRYTGDGSVVAPFICEFIPDDPGNPQNWTASRRWVICIAAAGTTFVVSFCSSAYVGAEAGVMTEFGVGQDVANLGLSLYLIGYIIGPLIWGPASEVFGRRNLMILTLAVLNAFNFGASESNSTGALLACRFLGSIFGSSPMTNAGGTIADMFPAAERGVPVAIFAAGPFMGPVLGPIVGGYTGEYAGWRWVMRVMALVSSAFWIIGIVLIPETYAPVILEKRARALEKATGKVFLTRLQASGTKPTLTQGIRTALVRPWALLFCEPIVAVMSIYLALVYGTLYMMFGAFPIVYQQYRGWTPGEGGLAFLGIAIGIAAAIGIIIPDDKYRYKRAERQAMERNEFGGGGGGGGAAPEARLPPGILGSVLMPVSLFWFSWTNGPEVHWAVSVTASIPFGTGMLLVFFSLTQYLIDSYTIYAASIIAGSGIVRSLFGAAFPLFTTAMYNRLGIHWASSVPAFLSLACMPFPLVFYRYGPLLRKRCHYARQAAEALEKIQLQSLATSSSGSHPEERGRSLLEK